MEEKYLKNYCIIFKVLTAVKMSVVVFWVVTPCELGRALVFAVMNLRVP
jgi:hypothetical protein